jgi:hypothetical protein
MFGDTPSYGFYIRHVKNLEVSNVSVSYMKEDVRPPFVLTDVKGADFQHIKSQRAQGSPTFVLKDVTDFSTHECLPVPDMRLDRVETKRL